MGNRHGGPWILQITLTARFPGTARRQNIYEFYNAVQPNARDFPGMAFYLDFWVCFLVSIEIISRCAGGTETVRWFETQSAQRLPLRTTISEQNIYE
jgi:hypothetical protein